LPGQRIRLTNYQLRVLKEFTADHSYGIELEDRGAAYTEVRLMGPEGDVVGKRLLYPHG
jgi:hypothetical protein